ncbi:hypothetical protein [Lentzea sp. NBRC 102530]|uniref:hypothetical protein n=1 Tax=Lentzea sp. NBRC 102530 TaxID=3032201 RepID=UPI0024A30E2A|nr:hypothetical protein [Lentzea sp. NBRC 102530]GLY47434.1 hypothetical protein Lesp01_10900 [Lentzea sp. NBRC 102530]
MSSSVGYYLSAADVEAQRRRDLRAGVASALARYDGVRARARGIGLTIPAVRAGFTDDTTSDELQELLRRVTTALDHADESINDAWRSRWQAEFGKVARHTVVTGLSARDELARAQSEPDRETLAVRSAVADAESLIESQGHRCDEQGVASAREAFTELVEATTVVRARTLSLEIAVIIQKSVARRRAATTLEAERVRLLELVRDAAAAEQESLRELVMTTADLDAAAGAVFGSIEREDRARHREQVADAAAQALEELGCVVGEEFESLLTTENEAVVGFRAQDGYGLLVRLPEDGQSLLTAVVRADDRAASGVHALAVQTAYCDETLPELHAKLRERGVHIGDAPFLRGEPGRPVPVAPSPLPGRQRRHETKRVKERERER